MEPEAQFRRCDRRLTEGLGSQTLRLLRRLPEHGSALSTELGLGAVLHMASRSRSLIFASTVHFELSRHLML